MIRWNKRVLRWIKYFKITYYSNIWFKYFTGKTGQVVLENGDRTPILELRNIQQGKPVHVCLFSLGSKNDECIPPKDNRVNIVWPGGVTKAPLDAPECGFDDEKCISKQ